MNPITEQVTHLIVKEMRSPHTERLVRIRFVKATTPEQVQLTCSWDVLGRLRPFVETEFVRVWAPMLGLNAVYPNLGKRQIEELPMVRVRRKWR